MVLSDFKRKGKVRKDQQQNCWLNLFPLKKKKKKKGTWPLSPSSHVSAFHLAEGLVVEDRNRRISWQPQPLHFSVMWLLGERNSPAREPADVRLHCPGGGSGVVAEGMSSEQPSPPSLPSAKASGNSAILSCPQSISANSLWSILNKLQSQRDKKKNNCY